MEINNIEQFSNDLRKATTKVISPINNNESKQRNEETNENSLKLPKACSKRGKKSRAQGAIGFDFASHWLKDWRESFTPICKRINRYCVIIITFHSLLYK